MSDDELDKLLAELNGAPLADLDRLMTPEYVEAQLQKVLKAAGYRTDDSAAGNSEPTTRP